MTRISREDLFMEVAHTFAKRSTCERGQVGCVIVQDRRIVATGYNGSPPGAKHCNEVGCRTLFGRTGCQRTIHAEANAIAWAARHGVSTDGAILYCTHGPCLACAQLIASAGIVRVLYDKPYRLTEGVELLDELNIPAGVLNMKLEGWG
jgi:dCMP deaminase